jgi:hypothetical protein
MPRLRITQTSNGQGSYRAAVALDGDGLAPYVANSEFEFSLTAEDQSRLRWYFEDYLQNPHDPAPLIAASVERRLAEIGLELFRKVFQSSDEARDLWATLRSRVNDTRVEVVTGVSEATTIPWELLRDPPTDVPLALRAQAFVRPSPTRPSAQA